MLSLMKVAPITTEQRARDASTVSYQLLAEEAKTGHIAGISNGGLRNTSVNSKISLFSSPKRPSSTKLEEHARDQLEMHEGGLGTYFRSVF